MQIEPRQRINDLSLTVIGVLKFVHEDGTQVGLNLGADFGMFGEKFGCERFEVVEVEGLALIFTGLVFAQGLVEQAMDGGKVRGELFIQREAGFFGEEFEMLIVNLTQVSHRGADSFNVSPVIFFPLRGGGFAKRGEGGEKRVPVLCGAVLLDFIPTREDRLAREFELVFGRYGLVSREVGEGICP